MDKLSIIVAIIGILGTLSSIFFAYLAFKRNITFDIKNDAISEGTILSDIVHIKACVDRVEKNLNQVDERYRNILERLVKVEGALADVTKRVDKL